MTKLKVWEEYIEFQNKYTEIYGDKCICFIQVGDFYEIYSIKKEGYMRDVCDIMGIIITQKNVGSNENPYMAGIPYQGIKKFVDRLIEQDYIIVIINQIGPKNSKGGYDKRDVERILCKSNVDVFFDISENNFQKTNNLLSIYLEEEQTLNNKIVITAGLSVINLTTGESNVYEISSNEYEVFEEVYRFVEGYNPSELIIHCKKLKKYNEEDIINRLNIMDRKYYYGFYDKKLDYLKLSYQESFFKKIFPNTGMMNVIQYLDLHYKLYALNSYVLLLQFAYEHESNILKNIKKPTIYNSNKHLILYNDALYQLNVVPNKIVKNSSKFKSLYDVINNTSTAIGRRVLKDRLLNPITDVIELNKKYDMVEKMLGSIEIYENLLKNVLDIDRYHRKLYLGILQPKEYAMLSESYDNILRLIDLYQKDFMEYSFLENDNILEFNEYISEYRRIFNVDIMIKYSLKNKNIEESIFNKGIYEEIDVVDDIIIECKNYFNDFIEQCIKWIKEYEGKSNKDSIKLSYQEKQKNKNGEEREGTYMITMSKRHGDILKQIFKNKKMDGYKFEFHTKSDIKLVSDGIVEVSDRLIKHMNKVEYMVKEEYGRLLDVFASKYNFDGVSRFVGEIDFVKSCAKTSKMYGYSKPEIVNNNKSFIDAIDLRHPIVERLSLSTKYIPNDVKLGLEEDGMLLFGINAGGKSCYLKSVGLSVILAQMGCYVPAKEFKYYPYHHIFTRISGDDNLFHGQSSFAVEMNEMRSILNYANENSLVLGDEVCRGTETVSALAIVMSALNKFSKNNINFIFATHLHQLSEMSSEFKNIGVYHISVDTKDGKLVYERKLKRGSGESIYGLEVAKHLINNEEFIDYAYKIRNKLLNIPEYIVEPKTSKYNSNVYVDKCEICNKTNKEEQLDVHHILFQSHCNENGLVEHVQKNDKSNLVVLCKTHHIAVHNKDLDIYGYKDTNDGMILDYKMIDKTEYKNKRKSRLKYNLEDIKIIEQYRGKPINYIIKKMSEEHQINISKTTLKKIYDGNYISYQ